MIVSLIGFKNAGKTTIGLLLAQRVSFEFIDTDRAIEELYSKINNEILTCKAIYKKKGEKYFRELESLVIEQIKANNNTIIACGGGVVLNKQNITFLKKLGPVVYLKVSKNILCERMKKNNLHADLENFSDDFVERFNLMYDERSLKYLASADIVVDISMIGIPAAVDSIISALHLE